MWLFSLADTSSDLHVRTEMRCRLLFHLVSQIHEISLLLLSVSGLQCAHVGTVAGDFVDLVVDPLHLPLVVVHWHKDIVQGQGPEGNVERNADAGSKLRQSLLQALNDWLKDWVPWSRLDRLSSCRCSLLNSFHLLAGFCISLTISRATRGCLFAFFFHGLGGSVLILARAGILSGRILLLVEFLLPGRIELVHAMLKCCTADSESNARLYTEVSDQRCHIRDCFFEFLRIQVVFQDFQVLLENCLNLVQVVAEHLQWHEPR